jgi:predicted nucleic acid-binding Zn ribbon protein
MMREDKRRVVSGKTKRVCPICGRAFEPKGRGYRKYCSEKCRLTAYLAMLRKSGKLRQTKRTKLVKCAVCGRKFAQSQHFRKYCSPECQAVGYYQLYRKELRKWLEKEKARRPKEIRKCVVCGRKFVPRANQKFCSYRCRTRGGLEKVRKIIERSGGVMEATKIPSYCRSFVPRWLEDGKLFKLDLRKGKAKLIDKKARRVYYSTHPVFLAKFFFDHLKLDNLTRGEKKSLTELVKAKMKTLFNL